MEPQTKPKFSPRDFFVQLGEIVALYVSVIFFLVLVFSILNLLFPDLNRYSYLDESSGVRMGISALIVALPLFIYFTWFVKKGEKADGGVRSGFRKWLLYLTLFLTGTTMAVDVIILINTFLNGNDFTVRFVLKALTVLIVSAIVFYYFLRDIRGAWFVDTKTPKIFAWVISIIVLGVFVWGFVEVGSPTTQRLRNNDSLRINNLQSIEQRVISYYQTNRKIPENLDILSKDIVYGPIPNDPVTKEKYEYKTIDKLSFELCANFETVDDGFTTVARMGPYDPNQNWAHERGRTCFTRTIIPELYPINSQPQPVKF